MWTLHHQGIFMVILGWKEPERRGHQISKITWDTIGVAMTKIWRWKNVKSAAEVNQLPVLFCLCRNGHKLPIAGNFWFMTNKEWIFESWKPFTLMTFWS